MMKRGHFNKVPMIIGNNKDEGLVFSLLLEAKMSHILPLLETDQFPVESKLKKSQISH